MHERCNISRLNERNQPSRWYVWDGSKLKLISQKPAKLGCLTSIRDK